jgi:Uma2 family endonuclease
MSAVAQPPHKTWTRAEIDALQAAGLLAGARLELIEGEVFDKMGQNPPHASAVCRFATKLAAVFGLDRVRIQMPVEPSVQEASRSLPEPDVAITRDGESAYRERHPGPGDTLLIAEISDSTYDFDVKRKGRLYARCGFGEYLVLDLSERELLVFRTPRDGVYTEIRVLRPGDHFYSLNQPNSGIAVSELF